MFKAKKILAEHEWKVYEKKNILKSVLTSKLLRSIPNNGCFERTVVHDFQRKLLKEELYKAKKILAEQESKVYEKKNILKSVLPSKLLTSVLLFTKITVFNTRKNVGASRMKKLEILSKEQERSTLFNLHDTFRRRFGNRIPTRNF